MTRLQRFEVHRWNAEPRFDDTPSVNRADGFAPRENAATAAASI
jgi:hypothetical protein